LRDQEKTELALVLVNLAVVNDAGWVGRRRHIELPGRPRLEKIGHGKSERWSLANPWVLMDAMPFPRKKTGLVSAEPRTRSH